MRTQFDNDHFRQMQRMERKKRMKSEKRRQVFFRRILKISFIIASVLVLAVAVREGVIRYIAQEQEAARNAGKEFLTGDREENADFNEEVPDRGAVAGDSADDGENAAEGSTAGNGSKDGGSDEHGTADAEKNGTAGDDGKKDAGQDGTSENGTGSESSKEAGQKIGRAHV